MQAGVVLPLLHHAATNVLPPHSASPPQTLPQRCHHRHSGRHHAHASGCLSSPPRTLPHWRICTQELALHCCVVGHAGEQRFVLNEAVSSIIKCPGSWVQGPHVFTSRPGMHLKPPLHPLEGSTPLLRSIHINVKSVVQGPMHL